MSYDINFWKLHRQLEIPPVEVYRRLCKVQPVEGLATLPVQMICDRLRIEFPDFDPNEKFSLVRIPGGSIEFIWSVQHFRFDLRGKWDSEAQSIVQIMASFDCPLFDPQIIKRYDSNDGMTLGELPNFTKAPSEPKAKEIAEKAAAIEKIRMEALARIKAKTKPNGLK